MLGQGVGDQDVGDPIAPVPQAPRILTADLAVPQIEERGSGRSSQLGGQSMIVEVG